jgi:hypothetical protein
MELAREEEHRSASCRSSATNELVQSAMSRRTRMSRLSGSCAPKSKRPAMARTESDCYVLSLRLSSLESEPGKTKAE